ncbi:MAG TPA: hypothetical protein HA367_09770, partial [Candidatus Methanofastidiosum sp.]|nr:hypothetical protein [Methanofastidiosum sp.]
LATDSTGNIIVTGYITKDQNKNFYTIKYDPRGNILWEKPYNGGKDDYSLDVAIDQNNKIIVTGYVFNGTNNDFFTIKY